MMLKKNIAPIALGALMLNGCASTSSCTGQSNDPDIAYMKAIHSCAQTAKQRNIHSFKVQTIKQDKISTWNDTDDKTQRSYTYKITISDSSFEIAGYCNVNFVLNYLPNFINGSTTFMSSPIPSSKQLINLFNVCMQPEQLVN